MNDDGSLSYSLNFKGANNGYTIQAHVNMGYCGSGDNWLRFGDYYNDFAHSFDMAKGEKETEKNINLVRYNVQTQPDKKENLSK